MSNTVSRPSFDKACQFVNQNGRKIDALLIKYTLGEASRASVITELKKYQNSDGGFGHGLEPDLRTPASTAVTTAVAVRILRTIGATSRSNIVKDVVKYLCDTIDKKDLVWPIIDKNVDLAVHAPWWNCSKNLSENWNYFYFNPSAELLGFLYHHKNLVEKTLLNRISERLIGNIEKVDFLYSYYEVISCVHLYNTDNLPLKLKSALKELLSLSIKSLDSSDEHVNYLELCNKKDNFVYPLVEKKFNRALKNSLKKQDSTGCWHPFWDWSEVDEGAWNAARVEWQGVLTRIFIITVYNHDMV